MHAYKQTQKFTRTIDETRNKITPQKKLTRPSQGTIKALRALP